MLAVSCVLLGAAVMALAAVVMDLNRRVKRMEKFFPEACERLGDPLYE